MSKDETKTIHEFLAENPDVDVSKAWERAWGIQTKIVDRVKQRFAVEKHPSCADREYYTSPDGKMEGSLNTYTGGEIDWLVHSWIGNRKASILDINATVFPSQNNRVPFLVVIFGTIPRLFFYAEYTPRVDLKVDLDYLNRYYEPANQAYLKLRSDPRFTWSASHGTYLRSILSPICSSFTAEISDDVFDTCEEYLEPFVDRWFKWMDEAEPVPEGERAAQQAYDYKVRELGYRLDPMNALVVNIFGHEKFEQMLDLRMGTEQMDATRL